MAYEDGEVHDELLNGGSLIWSLHPRYGRELIGKRLRLRSVDKWTELSILNYKPATQPSKDLFNAQYMESGTHRSVRLNNPNIRWEIQEDQGSPASSNTEMAASSIEPPAAAAPEPSSAVQMEEVEEIGAISTSTVKKRPRNQSMLLGTMICSAITQ